MQKRNYSNCGTDNYSAAAERPWLCLECGAEIPKEDNDGLQSNRD